MSHLGHLTPHSHDASDSVDSALESSAAGIRAVKISLLVLGVTALAQVVVVILSGSIALAADTIHNFSDALTAVPLWIAFAIGTRAATRRYTYGFGRAEDIAGLFVVAHDPVVGDHRRIRSGQSADPPAAHRARRLGRTGRTVRVHRQRMGCAVPHPGRSPDRLGGACRRRAARTHRRLHLACGVVRRRRCGTWVPARRSDHRPRHHGGHPRGTTHRRARRLPPADGRRRPRVRRHRRNRAGRSRGRLCLCTTCGCAGSAIVCMPTPNSTSTPG